MATSITPITPQPLGPQGSHGLPYAAPETGVAAAGHGEQGLNLFRLLQALK